MRITSIAIQSTFSSNIDVICRSWISDTLPLGYIIKQLTFFLPLNPYIAALPVSPDVAPRIVILSCIVPLVRKYSNRLPKNCRATSLKANVGP